MYMLGMIFTLFKVVLSRDLDYVLNRFQKVLISH